jgi:hypothetical protein
MGDLIGIVVGGGATRRVTDEDGGWLNSIDNARAEIDELMTESLRPDAQARLDHLYRQVLRRVRRDLEAYGETEAAAALPEICPFSLDQLVDANWYPDRHS